VAAPFYGFCSCRNITRLKEAYQRHTALEKSKVSGEPDEHHAPDKETEI